MYQVNRLPDLLQTFGRYAADPDLSFSWCDAANLAQRAREMEATR